MSGHPGEALEAVSGPRGGRVDRGGHPAAIGLPGQRRGPPGAGGPPGPEARWRRGSGWARPRSSRTSVVSCGWWPPGWRSWPVARPTWPRRSPRRRDALTSLGVVRPAALAGGPTARADGGLTGSCRGCRGRTAPRCRGRRRCRACSGRCRGTLSGRPQPSLGGAPRCHRERAGVRDVDEDLELRDPPFEHSDLSHATTNVAGASFV